MYKMREILKVHPRSPAYRANHIEIKTLLNKRQIINMVIKLILFNESQRSTLCEIEEQLEFDEECLSAVEQEIRASIVSKEQSKLSLNLSRSREADCLRYKTILKPRRIQSDVRIKQDLKILPGTLVFCSKSDRELGVNKHQRALLCNCECKNVE